MLSYAQISYGLLAVMSSRLHISPDKRSMETGVKAAFYHRENSPDSHDSICLKCFRTVSRQKAKEELAKDEATHRCEPERLANLATPIKPALR